MSGTLWGLESMRFLGYWTHDLDPVIISFTEQLAIRYYGLAYLAGFLLAYGFLWWAGKKGRSPLREGELDHLVTYLFAGVLIGGRIGYMILYQTETLWQAPWEIFFVWKGGMASHGGFVGVFLAVWWFTRRFQHSLFQMGDLICVAAPPGLFFGRIANFITGELWGKVTDVSWAVIFPAAQGPLDYDPRAFTVYAETLGRYVNPRHPSQLYEAALEGLFLGLYLQFRFWSGGAKRTPGRLAGEFFVLYGLLRIVGEHFREPDAGLLLGLSRGTFYSVVTIFAGAVILWKSRSMGAISPAIEKK